MINIPVKDFINMGAWLMKGAVDQFCKSFFLLAACCLFITLLFNQTGCIDTDDSDVDKWNRSGLKIYTDVKTGVQYVGNRHGLCVRIDGNGNPILSEDYP